LRRHWNCEAVIDGHYGVASLAQFSVYKLSLFCNYNSVLAHTCVRQALEFCFLYPCCLNNAQGIYDNDLDGAPISAS
jgi:hypothetical protein